MVECRVVLQSGAHSLVGSTTGGLRHLTLPDIAIEGGEGGMGEEHAYIQYRLHGLKCEMEYKQLN